MDLGRWGATVAADLASGNATTTAAVSGDDDHGEMGIWGCRPDEATRGAPTPPMRGFCSWWSRLPSPSAAPHSVLLLARFRSAKPLHRLPARLGSARLRRRAVRPQARVERFRMHHHPRDALYAGAHILAVFLAGGAKVIF
uniref:Uncharacterized protein n=1 Tax=Oryza barthii TaxID=65489 RepID=A0A0D3HEK3_9ORYZ